jgi:predicted enzyme involved in methoxymalonyl-ACP biosynthesis
LANKNIDNFDDDFGFSTIDTEELVSYNQPLLDSTLAEVEDLKSRLTKMHSAINKLLTNLSKNPEQELIKWPNRLQKINEFKLKLDRIRKGEE